MKEKIEKLYNDIELLTIKAPCNDLQRGFNVALDLIQSNLSSILGKSKTYDSISFLKELKDDMEGNL